MAIRLIVSEYNILWAALKHYRQHLEHVAATTADEDQQLNADEDLMKMDYMAQSIQACAKEDWGLELR
ncbi:hypothetical protein [Roseateles depolymerans]|uniref:Uncharacterized protein n=1 Tax=Roseateles depolymerans TaxID=76731 RepID=A0A0U3MTX4_9BURK|nr:hypothetical protein [Roseateles depolymerans]ALV06451.1 hypothetical protein RD2015_1975 [Roseateles depolymerans]REG19426.1 hypothetical protein DES44_1920 [Roseateles depolymerans]